MAGRISDPHGAMYVFEGPDNVGKTTLASLLQRELSNRGHSVISLSLPGRNSGTIGELVYRIHHHPEALGITALDATAVQILHLAAHVDAVKRTILPARKHGTTIILDRYWWSLAVYGAHFGADPHILELAVQIERMIFHACLPSCLFLLERPQNSTYQVTSEVRQLWDRYAAIADDSPTFPVFRITNSTVESAFAGILMRLGQISK